MIMHLAEHLEIPLRDRNGLLLAAGYAPAYPERPLESVDMAPVRQALERFLRTHEPYPALVIDRHHNLLAGNDALTTLTAGVAPELLEAPANALRVALHPEGMARRTVNLAEWSAHVLQRLRREVRMTADPQLQALYDELKGYPGVEHEPPGEAPASSEIVVPLRLRDQDGSELAFFGTITTFGTPADITLAEVAVEAFYPANARTAMRLLGDIGAVMAPGASSDA